MKDQFQREIEYMRISITDRCNLRCEYCVPAKGVVPYPPEMLLSFEEIVRICRIGAKLGIRKIKITGGEPLVRKGVAELVGMIHALPEIEQVTLTTNGVALADQAEALMANGLDAVNISLDTLDPAEFEAITRVNALDQVLAGIQTAGRLGLHTKINVVLREQCDWKRMLLIAKKYPISVRFIEMMPIGEGQTQGGISADDFVRELTKLYPDIRPDGEKYGNGPAEYYRIPGFLGSIGLIHAMHGKFCDKCNRIRLSATGQIKPCLCFQETHDLKQAVRYGTDEEVLEILKAAITAKPEAHRFEDINEITETKNMSSIGG